MSRISSLDESYVSGDLSIFPEAIDDKVTLYQAKNNAETTLKQSLSYNGKYIIVNDASAFPPQGLIRIGPKHGESGTFELVYYGKRSESVFSELIRGFAGSIQNNWVAGSNYVSNAVMAEHHNAIKDAILKIESHAGTSASPSSDSLNGILKKLEDKYLAPRPSFRAFPLKGKPPLTINFQNFSGLDTVRYLWDFGDGITSIERNPTHTYSTEGIYTVKLNIITITGAQGATEKSNYISASNSEITSFFYVEPSNPDSPNYSNQTALAESASPQTFNFVDQTDADITQRYWIFGDGSTETSSDPNEHSVSHIYDLPGEYDVSLLIVLSNNSVKRIFLSDKIVAL